MHKLFLLFLIILVASGLPLLSLGQEQASFDQQGLDAYNKGDYDLTIMDLSKAIQINSKDGMAYFRRGQAYVAKGNFDAALADYDRVIQIDPTFGPAYQVRGDARGFKGDYSGAILDFSIAIQMDSQSAKAYLDRGLMYFREGRADEAIADYNMVLLLDPQNVQAYRNRGDVYMNKGQFDKAIADYSQVIQLDPQNGFNYGPRGQAYLGSGKFQEAIADYSQAMQMDPGRAKVYLCGRGDVYVRMKDLDKATADYDEASRLDPKFTVPYTARGIVDTIKGEYAKAITQYEHAILLGSNEAEPYHNAAWILATCPQTDVRDGKKAIMYATKACELSKWKDPVILCTLAFAYASVSDWDNAIKFENQALGIPNQSAQAMAFDRKALEIFDGGKRGLPPFPL